MSSGPEFTTVEAPFINQLISMGWKLVTGNLDMPSVTGRETFREVLIKPDLRKAIARTNLRDGAPWLDKARVSQAVSAIERIAARTLARGPASHARLEITARLACRERSRVHDLRHRAAARYHAVEVTPGTELTAGWPA
jgi:hypothetical protein